ncbi:MAG: hypothetical protein K0U59_00045 [Gammaproteobacteria bacterium]|nr:hypothetical protein [Gammaproteobacteria bacterium]
MRVQTLALAVALASALGSGPALALGLGEIKLNSTLNQPLDAEIKLLQARGLGESEIRVHLASLEDFKRTGVEKTYLLNDLRFNLDYTGEQPVVRISSRAAIREPFLNFVLETRWPNGRLLREYTLLLDLPSASTMASTQPIRAAERERQQVRRTDPEPQIQPQVAQKQTATNQTNRQSPEQKPADPRLQPAAPGQPPIADDNHVYGPVATNQTLWSIALDTRKNTQLSVQQTMLAIQRLNPHAFINGNINLLKAGTVLRLPTAQEVNALNHTEAISQVALQNGTWRQRNTEAETLGAPLDARATLDTASTSEEVIEGRVSLAAPGDNDALLSGSGSGAEESEALTGALAATEEALDKSLREKTEMQDHLSQLNEQIDTMERLVAVSNDELAAVQTVASQNDETANEAQQPNDSETPQADAEEKLADASAVAAASEVSQEVINPANESKLATPPVIEPTLLERLMQNRQVIAIGTVTLFAGLLGFATWRRRKNQKNADITQASEPSFSDTQATLPVQVPPETETLKNNNEAFANTTTDTEIKDPLVLAKMHLASGRLDKAETTLLAALDGHVDNTDARLLLLEVYTQQQNILKFDDHYQQLRMIADTAEIDRATRMRDTLTSDKPHVALATDFSSEPQEDDDKRGSFDKVLSPAPQPNSNLDIDTALLDKLVLDLDTSHPNDKDAEENNLLEFDLDLKLDEELSNSTTEENGTLNLDELFPDDQQHHISLEHNNPDSTANASANIDDQTFDLLSELEETLDKDALLNPEKSSNSELDSIELDDLSEELAHLDIELTSLKDDSELKLHSPEVSSAHEGKLTEESLQLSLELEKSAVDELDFDLENNLDSNLNLLEADDELNTKLELAQAYLDMGDKNGAKLILVETLKEAEGEYRQRTQKMLDQIPAETTE